MHDPSRLGAQRSPIPAAQRTALSQGKAGVGQSRSRPLCFGNSLSVRGPNPCHPLFDSPWLLVGAASWLPPHGPVLSFNSFLPSYLNVHGYTCVFRGQRTTLVVIPRHHPSISFFDPGSLPGLVLTKWTRDPPISVSQHWDLRADHNTQPLQVGSWDST